jgi:hypothetical protein
MSPAATRRIAPIEADCEAAHTMALKTHRMTSVSSPWLLCGLGKGLPPLKDLSGYAALVGDRVA